MALLAGGCDPTPKPAPPIKVSPSASVDPKAKVEADYLAYWSALKAAHEASNPSYPDLRKHATGDQLQKAMQAIESLRSGGLQLRGDVTHESKVVSLTGSVANIDDCIDTSGRTLFDRKSGKPHTPQPSGDRKSTR
ncbi:MAG: hypothetical protein JWO79_4851, partial [Actinomycetia bacterium]|nr:hypothetical protein [Actinomycetes bacterium]